MKIAEFKCLSIGIVVVGVICLVLLAISKFQEMDLTLHDQHTDAAARAFSAYLCRAYLDPDRETITTVHFLNMMCEHTRCELLRIARHGSDGYSLEFSTTVSLFVKVYSEAFSYSRDTGLDTQTVAVSGFCYQTLQEIRCINKQMYDECMRLLPESIKLSFKRWE